MKYRNITVPFSYYNSKENLLYYIYKGNYYLKTSEMLKSFINNCLIYHIEIENKIIKVNDIEDVIANLVNNYKTFNIEKYKNEYSEIEYKYLIDLQKELKNNKIIIPIFKNNKYITDKDEYQFIFDALYETYNGSFYYQFGGTNEKHYHEHNFYDVIKAIFKNFSNFYILESEKEYYSKQELNIINLIIEKLNKLNYKTINYDYDEDYKKYKYLKENKKYISLFIHEIKGTIKYNMYKKECLKRHKIKEK